VLGSAVGELEHVAESEEEKGCEGCMRIHVKLDISNLFAVVEKHG
jgi:hypothetical protein